jgi:hypothetical protein
VRSELRDVDWLVWPSSPEELNKAHESGVEVFVGRRGSSYYDNLFSFIDAEELLSRRDLFYPFVRIFNQGRRLSPNEYTENLKFAGDDYPFYVSKQTLWDELRSGGTAYFTGIERVSTACLELKTFIERTLCAATDLSLFVTPPRTVGNLPRHYDNVDGLILQISGSKKWKLWGIADENPLLVESRADISDLARDDNIRSEYILKAGDLLYVPAGMIHETDTGEDHSIHITIGITPYRWYNLASEYLALMAGSSAQLENASLLVGINKIKSDLISRRYASRPGLISALIREYELTDETRLVWAHWIPIGLDETETHIMLEFHGNKVKMPIACSEILSKLSKSSTSITVGEQSRGLPSELAHRAIRILYENGLCVVNGNRN